MMPTNNRSNSVQLPMSEIQRSEPPVSQIRQLRSEWRHPPQACNWMHRCMTIPLIILFVAVAACFTVGTVCVSQNKGMFCANTLTIEEGTSDDLQWSEWAPCKTSFSCGVGDRVRYSTVRNMDPALSSVITMEYNPCKNSNDCPQRGQWANWMEWSNCTDTCGPFGLLVRQRQCLTLQNVVTDITKCDGMFHEVKSCGNLKSCNSTGPGSGTSSSAFSWMQWSGWSTCSVTCTPPPGVERRTRECADQRTGAKAADVTNCAGVSEEQRGCLINTACPSASSWGPWGSWSACKDLKGTMRQATRKRTCVAGSNSKQDCVGASTETKFCF